MKGTSPIVKGEVVFTETVPAFDHATIHIQLEDVSIADAGAFILGRETITKVQHNPDSNQGTVINFEIYLKDVEKIDPKNFYGIRVWVEMYSDGTNSSKGLYTDQSYRVLTQGFGNFVRIEF